MNKEQHVRRQKEPATRSPALRRKKTDGACATVFCAAALFAAAGSAAPRLVTDSTATPRERYGAARLEAALAAAPENGRVIVALRSSALLAGYGDLPRFVPGLLEAFRLRRVGDTWIVAGSDASGVLYGCLELARAIADSGHLPASLDRVEQPALKLRGTAIGMQKTEVTYDGAIYDYPYTPQDFPFFYDRKLWERYLDFLADNRINTLYLWNGHPFTSLLELPRYPDAKELPEDLLHRNIEMFRWLAEEADRRGIWVIQGFYNIHISHALAKARGLPFHYTTPDDFTRAYTRYCVSEFIRSYPNVGLMMTLGEALAPRYGPEWLTTAILPGVKDGLAALGTPDREPPVIVRAHATDIEDAMHAALPLYRNIYTMHKWNGESLTWTDVRGDVLAMHEKLVHLGSEHIANVHLLSNLEPFRWGSPEFVEATVDSMVRHGIEGLHLYPLRYWEWPVSADNTSPLLEQIDRDWIWFETWARYAWNPRRERAAERQYWVGRLAEKYGTREAGEKILDAYQLSGVCAPRLLPRIGITEGNRQAFSLGMLMTQLIDPERFNALTLLWTGDAPAGERLSDWVEREWRHQPHSGETPVGVAREVVKSSAAAVEAADEAAPRVTRNRDEFLRLANDMRSIHALMQYYDAKTRAAASVLRYGYSHDVKDLEAALPLLRQSVDFYRELVKLTDTTYRQACSVHSASRRIPFLGAPGRYTHWRDCLPEYEKELATFERNLRLVRTSATPQADRQAAALAAVPLGAVEGGETFRVEPGARLFSDLDISIENLAGELHGLTGIRISAATAQKEGVRLVVDLPQPAQVLVGFFRGSKQGEAAAPPADEWNPTLMNGVTARGHASFTVWAHALTAGKNELDFGRGEYVVLGFVRSGERLEPRMAFFGAGAAVSGASLDWLFE